MIWLYAVCEQPERPLPRVRGLEERAVEGIACRDLLAIVTRHDDVPAFRALVRELSGRHRIRLQLTGPWPAFHFSR